MRSTILAAALAATAGEAGAVCVMFEHAGYRGRAFALQPGECAVLAETRLGTRPCGGYAPVAVKGFNDIVSSVIVADGSAAFFWEHIGGPLDPRDGRLRFAGAPIEDLSRPPHDWNDEATVVRCWSPALAVRQGR